MSVTSIKSKTAEAVAGTVPRDLPGLLRAYAGTTGVITSRCYTADQVVALAELREAFPDAVMSVNHELKTAALTFTVDSVPLRFVFELREVSSLVEPIHEGSVSE